MKTNLRNRPKKPIGIYKPTWRLYEEWFERFEKGLRKNKPIITCPVCPKTGCPLKKEILGE